MFQLTEEAQVYKEIEEIDPAKHVRLSAKGIADLQKPPSRTKHSVNFPRLFDMDGPISNRIYHCPYELFGHFEMNW